MGVSNRFFISDPFINLVNFSDRVHWLELKYIYSKTLLTIQTANLDKKFRIKTIIYVIFYK
jgi:hypothetical protein